MDQDREPTAATGAEITSSSSELTNTTKEVVTETAKSAEKIEDVGSGEVSVDECDSECKEGEREEEEEGEGERMELGEKGEDSSAHSKETDIQRETEGVSKTDDKASTGKHKVHVHVCCTFLLYSIL